MRPPAAAHVLPTLPLRLQMTAPAITPPRALRMEVGTLLIIAADFPRASGTDWLSYPALLTVIAHPSALRRSSSAAGVIASTDVPSPHVARAVAPAGVLFT